MRRKKFIHFIIKKAPHILLLIMLFAVSVLFGLYLPQKIPLHWDSQGIIDRVGTKYELVFLLPCAAAIIFAVGIYAESRFILPSRKMRSFLSFIQFFFLVLFFALQTRNLLRAVDIWTPVERLISVPMLLFYAYAANVFGDAEYLSQFGIKTKWTIGSKSVWDLTNQFASRLFKICALLMLIPIFNHKLFYAFLLVPPALSILLAILYSHALSNLDIEAKKRDDENEKHDE
jgi:uncharacterized membrane protein